MTIKRMTKEDREEMKYEGVMRLVSGVMLHILDMVSISGKWTNKDIRIITLLEKRRILFNMRRWMKGWQWSIWVNIYAEYNRYSSGMIKKRFHSIREDSIKEVKKRIHEKKEKEKDIELQNL